MAPFKMVVKISHGVMDLSESINPMDVPVDIKQNI